MVYKVNILMNYKSRLAMIQDKGSLIGETREVDEYSFSYIFNLDTFDEYKGFITDQQLKKNLIKIFIAFYGEHMKWNSFRILSIRKV